MKIETQPLEDHQVKLAVEIESESLEEAKHKAARQIARRTKIPGFRPGKAPYNIIQRHVGEEALLEEGVEILVNDLYPKIIEESKIQPYGPGKFEKLASLDPLILEFIVPLMAEVQLGDYRSIRFPYESPQISDFQVEEVLQNLRQRQAIEEPVNRPALEGDRLHIRLSANRIQPDSGEDPALIRERPLTLIIAAEGQETSDEWPYSGFSRQLIGLSSGEQRIIEYTFPDNSDFETLREVSAEFHVQTEDVKSRTLPRLSDEFAHSIGEYSDLEALTTDIRQSLEQEAKEAYDSQYDDQIVSAAIEQATLKYPRQMLDAEIDQVLEQLQQRLKAQNLALDIYMKTRGLDEKGVREEARPVAESRLKRSLVLLEIAEAENIQVDPQELQSETERTLSAMSRFMSEAELRKVSSQNLLPNLVGNILAEMRVSLTLERMRSIARGELDAQEISENLNIELSPPHSQELIPETEESSETPKD